MKQVVFGFLGTTLDQRGRKEPLKRWRPSVSLCRHEDLPVDRLELIHGAKSLGLAEQVVEDIAAVSPKTRVHLHCIPFEDPWDFAEMYTKLSDFVRSYNFDPDTEDYFVNITTGTHVAQICWFLLTEARFVPAQLLQLSPPRRLPSGQYDATAAGHYSIIDLDLSRYEQIATRFAAEREVAASFLKSGIDTRNPAFNAMIDEIEKVAIRSRAPVLLTGPTGAGKSQLARRIFELKKSLRQVTGPFVEVNCATLRGDQAMSTLFGHVKGAFTGALSARAGLMKSAHNGVLFLDEIGELGLDEQAMCLRAIEEKSFLPVGSDKEQGSDFQLIAGTNQDLPQRVREGRFREDLLARLNLWTFRLPALKDRREDIEPNVDFELKRYCDQEARNVTFNKEARDSYLKFATSAEGIWAANFRDLSASITRMATFSPQGRITQATVRDELSRLRHRWQSDPASASNVELALCEVLPPAQVEEIDPFDRAQLAAVIETCRKYNSLSAAGRKLFAVSRRRKSTANDADRLRKYLQRFGLRFEDLA
ncbi:MAG: RNA repair transcriptional activator RtcR [Alphaproteobacteria bacterium]|nr:RNA repair transcriptional activator RtcR [Alphaproteobacteria bacterium]